MQIKLISAFFVLVLSVNVFAIDSWTVHASSPQCRKGVFCDRDEIPGQAERSGVVEKLLQLAKETRQQNGRLTLAFMSFTHQGLWQGFCAETKQGLELDGFFDSKAGPPEGLAHQLESECQGPSGNNVKMRYMGAVDTLHNPPRVWRLHHNKFVVAELPNGRARLIFSSANLSNSGLSINFENWNFISSKAQDPFIKDHLCDIQAMKNASLPDGKDSPTLFRKTLDKCLSSPPPQSLSEVNRRLDVEGAISLFSPDSADRNFNLLETLIEDLRPHGRIQVATYYFLHKKLAEALQRAQNRGVHVQLLIDDDLLSGEGSLPGQRKFYWTYLAPEKSGFEVRAVKTNFAAKQLLHHKFLILESGTNVRVFGGAGQFTTAAFKNNYENFYLIQSPEVVKQYRAIFDEVWARQ